MILRYIRSNGDDDTMINALVSALFLLTLVACGGANPWVKTGVNEDQMRLDQRSCRSRAGGRNIDVTRDIRGGSISGGRDDTRVFVENTRDIKVARSFERVFVQCMRGRGYAQPKT